jgi:tRNA-splicing ligase RtcB
MRVPSWLFLSDKLLKEVEDGAIEQIANVAFMPGIYKHSIALPDMHFGYGFPIGGVAALDFESGGLSPGGIGFDINCGVRLLRTNLNADQVRPKIKNLLESIFINVPSGVGETGKIKLSFQELDKVLEDGVKWAVDKGYGTKEDMEHLEEKGCMRGADASKISIEAKKRGAPQLGTLGAGNHFLEIQMVEKIYLPEVAKVFGIDNTGQVCVLIHTGSRGFGHQVCTDYLRILESKFRNEINSLPDRELVYAPSGTRECEDYFSSMVAAANYAWTNRQMIMHWVRESFVKTLGTNLDDIGLEVVYDVAHNIGKIEEHDVDGKKIKMYVHRKGATRTLPAGHMEIPSYHRKVGQCVLIPGSMGTASYILVGSDTAKETFYSTAHGAGRVSSRTSMLRGVRGEEVARRMNQKGILSKAASWKVMAEEAPEAYKDIDEVTRVTEEAGISKRVVRLVPLGVIKG